MTIQQIILKAECDNGVVLSKEVRDFLQESLRKSVQLAADRFVRYVTTGRDTLQSVHSPTSLGQGPT